MFFRRSAPANSLDEAAGRHPENLARSHTIRLVARILCGVEAPIAIELPFLTRNPSQDTTFDCTKIGADQDMPGCRAYHRPAAFTDDGEGPFVARAYVLIVAGSYRSNRGVELILLEGEATQVLRLGAFSTPATGRSAVIAEATSHPIIFTSTGEQRVDFFYGGLRTAETQLEYPLHRRWQVAGEQQFLNGFLAKIIDAAALRRQPSLQPRDLVDLGDNPIGDFAELSVDLWRGCLGDPACRFGEAPVDVKAAIVD